MSFLIPKKSTAKLMRLFFATDLHASERAFRKFLNAAKFYRVDVLVMGGDVVGKLVVSIIREGNGRYRATYGDRTHYAETADELKQLQERLGMVGFYFRVMEEGEFRALAGNREAVEKLFHELARERLTQWVETYQPLLSLHGHIHESPGVIRIGRTLCINPGSEYNEGILRGAIVSLKDGKLEGYQLTAG